MAVFPILDFLQIKARYPKAVAKITEWLFNQEELKSATEDFIDPENPEGAKEQFAGLLIQMDPRKLYDIFDSFGIYVSIRRDGGKFWFDVEGDSTDSISQTAGNRHQAEQSGLHDAFELLEKQL